jgi:hypothetical protein
MYNRTMTRRIDFDANMAECTYCHEWKDLFEFGVRTNDKYGYSPRCKSCSNMVHAAYKIARRDRDWMLDLDALTEPPPA